VRASFAPATFDPIVLDGMRCGAYPGAALVIGRRDTILFSKGYGRLTWSESSAAVDPDSTIYDLASLTKVMVTTSAMMMLVERGRVQLDAPVATYVPDFAGPGTAGITVRRLLTHTSGLRADLPDSELKALPPSDGAALMRRVLHETPRWPPGTRVVYSDLNAILLGEIVRRVTGEGLDAFAARELFAPLGLSRSWFRPPARLARHIAPTGAWRGRPVAGVVNDPSAARLGGVSGNAGLFGSAADVARFAQFMLRDGALPDGRRLLRPETVRLFVAKAVESGRGAARGARALGWQAVPTGERVSSAGVLFGPRSYGHTGWTGTSLWIDPDRDLFVVLLTNRAFAPRARRSFTLLKEVRGRVADAAARASDAR
jgi:beta-N-acetylhexosaminidase